MSRCSSNRAPDFWTRSSENFSINSSLLKISCSVPSFQPSCAKKFSIASGNIPSFWYSVTLFAPSRLPNFLLPVGAMMCGTCARIGGSIFSASYKDKYLGVLAIYSEPRMTWVIFISKSSMIWAKLYVGSPSALIRIKSSSASGPADNSPMTASCQEYRLISGTLKRSGMPSRHSGGFSGRWSRYKKARFSVLAWPRKVWTCSGVYGSA